MNPRSLFALVLCGWLGAAAEQTPAGAGGANHCSATQPWPNRFTLEFSVVASRGALALEGDNELSYALEGNQYLLRSSTRSLAYRASQESRGTLVGNVLRPREYMEQSQRRGAQRVHFDWEGQSVTFTANAEQPGRTAPMLQDRLSLLLQLGERLRAQIDGEVELPVAGVRRITPYRFERLGQEVVEVPAGRFHAVRVARQSDDRSDRIEAWLAPSQCWLPVKVRFVDDDHGLVLENQLRKAVFD